MPLLKNFMRSEFYEKDGVNPAKVVLTTFIENKPLAYLEFNAEELDGLIEVLEEMRNKFDDTDDPGPP